jgi:hypothetical protein
VARGLSEALSPSPRQSDFSTAVLVAPRKRGMKSIAIQGLGLRDSYFENDAKTCRNYRQFKSVPVGIRTPNRPRRKDMFCRVRWNVKYLLVAKVFAHIQSGRFAPVRYCVALNVAVKLRAGASRPNDPRLKPYQRLQTSRSALESQQA